MTANSQLCYKCRKNKPLSEFNKSSHHKNGHRNICRDCRNTHRTIIRKYEKIYPVLLYKQGYCCAICGKSEEENGKRLSLDHNHETYQVRSLLCTTCNTALGNFKDSEELLLKAIAYLKKWDEDATA